MGNFFYYVGMFIGGVILCYLFYHVYKIVLLPFFRNAKHKFFVSPKLRKLQIGKFKIIRRLHPYPHQYRKSINLLLVTNCGIFVIKRKSIFGVIAKAEGRDGNVNRHNGKIRFLPDHVAENLNDIAQVKTFDPLLKEVPIFSVVVYPDGTEVNITGSGYVGKLSGMNAFIESCNTAENAVSNENKEKIIKLLKEKNTKNMD